MYLAPCVKILSMQQILLISLVAGSAQMVAGWLWDQMMLVLISTLSLPPCLEWHTAEEYPAL